VPFVLSLSKDLLARTVIEPRELQGGVLTTLPGCR
jgi:ABC-type Fe3+-siderophore transport system permease subunit